MGRGRLVAGLRTMDGLHCGGVGFGCSTSGVLMTMGVRLGQWIGVAASLEDFARESVVLVEEGERERKLRWMDL